MLWCWLADLGQHAFDPGDVTAEIGDDLSHRRQGTGGAGPGGGGFIGQCQVGRDSDHVRFNRAGQARIYRASNCCISRLTIVLGVEWQRERDRCALSFLAFHPDRTAVTLDELSRDIQTES